MDASVALGRTLEIACPPTWRNKHVPDSNFVGFSFVPPPLCYGGQAFRVRQGTSRVSRSGQRSACLFLGTFSPYVENTSASALLLRTSEMPVRQLGGTIVSLLKFPWFLLCHFEFGNSETSERSRVSRNGQRKQSRESSQYF